MASGHREGDGGPGLNEIYQYVHPAVGCAHCPELVRNRHHVVWSRGPAKSPLMAIGEAPGRNEDIKGIPFVGRAGQLMDRLLLQAGFNPRSMHIANRVMCRPPDNRDPDPSEVANCLPWLVEHIRMVEPKALVLFGRYAISLMFDLAEVSKTQGLMYTSICPACGGRAGEHLPRYAEDGNWKNVPTCAVKASTILVASIYHPASALRDPEQEPAIARQLRRLHDELELRGWLPESPIAPPSL